MFTGGTYEKHLEIKMILVLEQRYTCTHACSKDTSEGTFVEK